MKKLLLLPAFLLLSQTPMQCCRCDTANEEAKTKKEAFVSFSGEEGEDGLDNPK